MCCFFDRMHSETTSHKESLELHKMYAGEGLVAIVMGEEHYYI